MPASTDSKALFASIQIDPVKRARQIREYLAKKKINPSRVVDETLDILDQIALEQEAKSA